MGLQRSLFVLVLCLTFSLGNQVNAEEISLLSNPGPKDNALWLIDPDTGQHYGQVGYYPPDSRWHIAQWGILNRLPAKTKRYGKGWKTQNKDGSVSYLPSPSGGYVVDFKQDSRNPNYGSTEFDLFLEPNHFIYPTLPQNLMHYDNQPSLGSLTAVLMKAWQMIVYAWHGERGSLMTGIPGSDLASTLLAVAMINPYTSPQQILFYQVITYDSRGLVFNKDWFDNGTWDEPYMTYGVDDSVQNYGMQALTIGNERRYNLNIIDRLKQVVQEGPASLDKDLHHWKVAGGLYFGSWVNGEAVIHSKISSIDFTYEM